MCKIKENFIHLFFVRESRKERSLIMSKKLVAFFSASGTTKKAAEIIVDAVITEGRLLNGVNKQKISEWVKSL